jgi:hypothetical protein
MTFHYCWVSMSRQQYRDYSLVGCTASIRAEAERKFPETSVAIHQTTCCHIPGISSHDCNPSLCDTCFDNTNRQDQNYISTSAIIESYTHYWIRIQITYCGVFPHAGTVEPQIPQSANVTIEVRVSTACCWVTPRSLLHNAEVNTSLRLVATKQ